MASMLSKILGGGGMLGGPGAMPGKGLPGRYAARAYSDPRMSLKYAPGRGALSAIYSARMREASGKPMTDIGGRGAPERALGAYEAGGAYGKPLSGSTSARVNPGQPGAGVAGGQG